MNQARRSLVICSGVTASPSSARSCRDSPLILAGSGKLTMVSGRVVGPGSTTTVGSERCVAVSVSTPSSSVAAMDIILARALGVEADVVTVLVLVRACGQEGDGDPAEHGECE